MDSPCLSYVCYSVLQCRDGFAGDGEECDLDPDLDAIPVKGLSCTLPNCRKVSSNVSHLILMLPSLVQILSHKHILVDNFLLCHEIICGMCLLG